MKILGLFMTLALAVTTRFAVADEGAPTAAAPMAAVADGQVATPVEVPVELGGPLTPSGYCEDVYNDCTPPCLELVGSAKGVCLRQCRAEYEDCIGS